MKPSSSSAGASLCHQCSVGLVGLHFKLSISQPSVSNLQKLMISGPAAAALDSLSDCQVSFLQSISKAELHAHLHGCIPLETLQQLAKSHSPDDAASEIIQAGIAQLEQGAKLDVITDFFQLFPAIYSLTSTPENLHIATAAVLNDFLSPSPKDGGPSQCQYLELRTTPRKTATMSRTQYLEVVLVAMDKFSSERCALTVSVDWRMAHEDAMDTVNAAISLKKQGRRVVGLDICGDFQNAKPEVTIPCLKIAQDAGLHVTVHIAESLSNPLAETTALLELMPSRLGHATFLDRQACEIVKARKIPVEICLSSNLLCKTVSSLADHHILSWIETGHPISICTDDTLVFRTNLMAEYALLLAKPPLGLGLSQEKVASIARMSMDSRFGS